MMKSNLKKKKPKTHTDKSKFGEFDHFFSGRIQKINFILCSYLASVCKQRRRCEGK